MLFPKLQASPDFVPVAVEVVAQVSPNAPEPACDAVICDALLVDDCCLQLQPLLVEPFNLLSAC